MLRAILSTVLVVLLSGPAYGLTLEWDPVTTGTDENGVTGPLAPGNEVTEYRVYQCGPAPKCDKSTGTIIGIVNAPSTTIDISTQPAPRSYAVTAANIVAESDTSLPLKVTPPDIPKNQRLK